MLLTNAPLMLLTSMFLDQWVHVEATMAQEVVFWLFTTLLTYHFYKAWRTDPGYLKADRDAQIRVGTL